MKNSIPLLVSASAACLLAGCANTTSQNILDNPLYAEYYYDDVVNHIVDLELADDASIKNTDAKKSANARREFALKASKDAVALQMTGLHGIFAEMQEYSAGETLLLGNTLYFSPDFTTAPGVDLHVYLSPALDPRDVPFPGQDDIDLGSLATPYGVQQMQTPDTLPDLRSVVLWDKALKRLHGFAQLQVGQ